MTEKTPFIGNIGKFQFGAGDIFRYLIPGFVLLTGISLLSDWDIFNKLVALFKGEIKYLAYLVLFIITYATGFTIAQFAALFATGHSANKLLEGKKIRYGIKNKYRIPQKVLEEIRKTTKELFSVPEKEDYDENEKLWIETEISILIKIRDPVYGDYFSLRYSRILMAASLCLVFSLLFIVSVFSFRESIHMENIFVSLILLSLAVSLFIAAKLEANWRAMHMFRCFHIYFCSKVDFEEKRG